MGRRETQANNRRRNKLYSIGDVAQLTGVSPHGVRYAIERGYIPRPDKVATGERRYYDEAQVKEIIQHYKERRPPPGWMSANELMRLLGVSNATMAHHQRKGNIPKPKAYPQYSGQEHYYTVDQVRDICEFFNGVGGPPSDFATITQLAWLVRRSIYRIRKAAALGKIPRPTHKFPGSGNAAYYSPEEIRQIQAYFGVGCGAAK